MVQCVGMCSTVLRRVQCCTVLRYVVCCSVFNLFSVAMCRAVL